MPNFAASIIARLGLETEGFRAELDRARAASDSAHGSFAASADRSTGAHEKFLSSNHRVARQVENFTKDLFSGADASSVFATGLEGLGRSLNLSLGTLAGIGIGVAVVGEIGNIISEYQKLNEEIDKVLAPRAGPRATPLSALKEQAAAAAKEIAEIDKQLNSEGQSVKRKLVVDTFQAVPGATSSTDELLRRREATENRRREALEGVGAQQTRLNAIRSSGLPENIQSIVVKQLDFRDQIIAAAKEGGELLAGPIKEAARIDLAEAADKIAKANLERLKLSSKELIEQGPTFADQNKASLEAINNAENARKAEQLRNEARQIEFRNPENIYGTRELFSRADQLTQGISSLKDSEKELTGAIDASSIIKSIDSRLGELNQNVKGISFVNQ